MLAVNTVNQKSYESFRTFVGITPLFFERYNMWRPHQGLDDRTPDDVYWSTLPKAKEVI